MKKKPSWEDARDDGFDFAEKASNLYRTKHFIVKQVLKSSVDSHKLIHRLCSEDTYYERTPDRDMHYELLFDTRDPKEMDGKRIKASYYIRTYVK